MSLTGEGCWEAHYAVLDLGTKPILIAGNRIKIIPQRIGRLLPGVARKNCRNSKINFMRVLLLVYFDSIIVLLKGQLSNHWIEM